MKVVFDTNVVLDTLLDRGPHTDTAIQALRLVEASRVTGGICATTLITVDYLVGRYCGQDQARSDIGDLLALFEVARVDGSAARRAMQPQYPDFEDGIVAEAARQWGAHAIVTRDPSGFRGAQMTIYTPLQFVSLV